LHITVLTNVRFGFKSGHPAVSRPCPLLPRKRTFGGRLECPL